MVAASPLAQGTASSSVGWSDLTQLVSVCGREMRRALAGCIAECGVTTNEFLLLWACDQPTEDDPPQNELAATIGVSPAQLSGLVERMTQQGVLLAHRRDDDRRKRFLRLSEAGRELFERCTRKLDAVSHQLNRQVSAAEQTRASDLLRQLLAVAQTPATLRIHSPEGDHGATVSKTESEK